MPPITLTTDFGGVYPARMKGRILSICPDAVIIDISHDVPPGNRRQGAFILASCAADFPRGTIHAAVVDPGVGTDRRPLLIHNLTTDQYFIGPDNGLLIDAAAAPDSGEPDPDVFVIDDRLSFLPGNDFRPVSATFHGRDIFAPAAAALAAGCPPEKIGRRIAFSELVRLPDSVKSITISEDAVEIKTTILMTDDFGNMITAFPGAGLPEAGKAAESAVTIMDLPAKQAGTYADAPPGTLLLLTGSHGNLEIAVSMGSAEKYFQKKGLTVGENEAVTIKIERRNR